MKYITIYFFAYLNDKWFTICHFTHILKIRDKISTFTHIMNYNVKVEHAMSEEWQKVKQFRDKMLLVNNKNHNKNVSLRSRCLFTLTDNNISFSVIYIEDWVIFHKKAAIPQQLNRNAIYKSILVVEFTNAAILFIYISIKKCFQSI